MPNVHHLPSARRQPAVAAASVVVPACLMRLVVPVGAVTTLRQLVMRICGDALNFMRIAACEHGARMKVSLSLSQSVVRQVTEAVMRWLPEAEFGRLSGAARSAAGSPQ